MPRLLPMATPIHPLVDRILGGKLDERLKAWRAEGLTYDGIARRLDAEHDIDVTSETVRKWCASLAEATA